MKLVKKDSLLDSQLVNKSSGDRAKDVGLFLRNESTTSSCFDQSSVSSSSEDRDDQTSLARNDSCSCTSTICYLVPRCKCSLKFLRNLLCHLAKL